MQQHLMQMQPMMASYYPNNVTTDHIQQYLDENKSLILKIVESQNSGKLNECAENQARLQQNLMYLAAIADSQPQPPTAHSQYPPSGFTPQQQAQQMTLQSLMAARSSMVYAQQPYSAMQQQQALNGQLGTSSGGTTTGFQMLQCEAGGFPDFGRTPTGESVGFHADGRGLAAKQGIGGSSAEDHN